MENKIRFLLYYFLTLIISCLQRASGLVQDIYFNEDTTGLGIVDGLSTFPDNSVILRMARYDPATGCNQPSITFRTFIGGDTAVISPLDLPPEENAAIPIDSFCAPPPAPKRRSIYIFENNLKRDLIRRRNRKLFKRTPPHTTGSKTKSKVKETESPSSPPPEAPASPPPSGSPAPESPAPESPPPPESPKGKEGPKGKEEPAKGKEKAPEPVSDKIKIVTFGDEYVLVYFPCGEQTCGKIYSSKNIQAPSQTITLLGGCDETDAVTGSNGFLFLCFRETTASILWETWNGPGGSFKQAFNGNIANVTVPSALKGEKFGGALFRSFSTGPSSYSIIMGSVISKPVLDVPRYVPPLSLFSYFITEQNPITGPTPIYNIGDLGGGTVEFQIQTCVPLPNFAGSKCLVSYKEGEADTSTVYVTVSFSPSGEPISTTSFLVPHAPDAVTPATLPLSYGGYCIGVVSTPKGGGKALDCLVYSESGVANGTWGIASGLYGKLGGTPGDVMWAVKPIDDPKAWEVSISTNLVGMTG